MRVVDLYSVKPVDRDTLRTAAEETGRLTMSVLAPLVFLLLWRHSFDGCDGTRIDPAISLPSSSATDFVRPRMANFDAT